MVAPPGLRLAGVKWQSKMRSSLHICLNILLKRARPPFHRAQSFRSLTTSRNLWTVQGFLTSTNWSTPNCLRFLGLATRIAAKGWLKVKLPGREMSVCFNFSNSPGLSMQRTPISSKVAKTRHLFCSSIDSFTEEWALDKPIIKSHKGIGKGGRRELVLCSSQTRRFSQAVLIRPCSFRRLNPPPHVQKLGSTAITSQTLCGRSFHTLDAGTIKIEKSCHTSDNHSTT